MGRRLGVSTRTAYNLVADGEVPVIRLRGVLRVPVAALDQWFVDRDREALDAVRLSGRRSMNDERRPARNAAAHNTASDVSTVGGRGSTT